MLIISLLASLTSKAQTISNFIEFADQQFEAGNYEIASREYNRAYFLGFEKRDELLFKIASCYFQQKNYSMAGNFFDKAYQFASTDSIANEAVLAKALCMLMNERYVIALAELYNLNDTQINNQLFKSQLINAIANYHLKNDSASHLAFIQALKTSNAPDSAFTLLDKEFEKVYRYQKRYNPLRAYILSAILPGSGQFASGAYHDGINSFVLVAALAGISIRIMSLYSFWDAAVAILPWAQRYYIGGMEGAEESAKQKIETKRYNSYLQIIDITN